jgi:protein phosphatase
MGGALAGEVASRLAVETVRDRMLQLQAHRVYGQLSFPERLRLSIEEANLLINGESRSNNEHKGLGATFTAAAIQGHRVFFAQVGDSRAYLIRHGKIIRITKDQSLVQQLIDAGQITEEEAETHSYRNVILQALGAHSSVNVEINSVKLCQLDAIVLCSDGLSGKVRADEIAQMVQAAGSPHVACQKLIALANERGGEDNITVIVAHLSGSGLPASDTKPVEPHGLVRQPDTPTELIWGADADTGPLIDGGRTADLADEQISSTEPLPEPSSSQYPYSGTRQPRETSPEIPRYTEPLESPDPTTMVVHVDDVDEYVERGKKTSKDKSRADGSNSRRRND